MNKLQAALKEGAPLIAVSFTDRSDLDVARRAVAAGLDVAELRFDRFASLETSTVAKMVEAFRDVATIGTARSRQEGGDWALDEATRLKFFASIAPLCDAIDIELSARTIVKEVLSLCRRHEKLAIVSYHNFDATPPEEELLRVADEAKSLGADSVKISTMVNSPDDLLTLGRLATHKSHRGLLVIGMGAEGAVSRICFPAFGSPITYSYIGSASAPGQLPFEQLFDMFCALYPQFKEKKARRAAAQ